MIRDRVAATANLLRLHTAGFEGFIFTAGPMLANMPARLGDLAVLWLLGVLVNGYIFALNDLVDLPRDRVNPAKSRSPLVTGALSERVALLWSLCLPLAAMAITALHAWPVGAQVAFVLLLVLGAVINVYQKATGHPLLMDVLFAVAMAAPLPVTAWAVSGSAGPVVWWATALLLALSLQLNSVAGNLKDLASDRRTGFRTVAVAMGADIGADGELVTTPSYRRYCWSLFAVVMSIGAITLWAVTRGTASTVMVACASVAVAAVVAGAMSLRRLLDGRRPPSPRGRELYFAAGFLMLLLAIAVRAPWSALVPVLIGLALWELVSTMGWAWYWRSGQVTAEVV
ncbi:UbiA family prenyltransferase [Saccharothrix texasensis]|uniref:UbiA prenyltransferase family protein n=1 Tax=Saccharothrix texasensis TaxID=103734 RepID=A0A3N1GZR8_9PSEU|nr:UbiA family prenyltransferase [Saccharothrix texasensis]ROP35738.1 UbiA prenyltransferase family protein [Saccharothrix texasensis]